MVHSPDCSRVQMQCRSKEGRKRGRRSRSIGDGSVKAPVLKEEEFSAGSRRAISRKRIRTAVGNGGPTTPDVSYTQDQRTSDDDNDDDDCSPVSEFQWRQALQAELRKRTEELLIVQRQRDAAIASRRMQLDHGCDQVRSELRRTTEALAVARKERDDAMTGKQLQLEQQCDHVYDIEMTLQTELQRLKRDLSLVQQQRDHARTELRSQSTHQQEQVRQIETELHAELNCARESLALAQRERDLAVAAKHAELEQQCDLVEELEMGLQMELRRVTRELDRALHERERAVMEIHLDQEHQREQIRQIEMELQGNIQLKNEQLKCVQREGRHCLHPRCAHVAQVEMELQRDLQEVLEELQGIQEERDYELSQGGGSQFGASLERHFDQVREIEQELVQSREKLNCLRSQYSAELSVSQWRQSQGHHTTPYPILLRLNSA